MGKSAMDLGCGGRPPGGYRRWRLCRSLPAEPYNPGFLHFPTVVALHVVLGGVYLALAPFQFVRRIRSRHLDYHRWAGRMLVSVGLVVGLSALFMALVIPKGGWPRGL